MCMTDKGTEGLLKVRQGEPVTQWDFLCLCSWCFRRTSIKHKVFFPQQSGHPSLSAALQGSGPFTLPLSDLIVQFRMTGFHLQLPPGSAHLIPLQSPLFTWKMERGRLWENVQLSYSHL